MRKITHMIMCGRSAIWSSTRFVINHRAWVHLFVAVSVLEYNNQPSYLSCCILSISTFSYCFAVVVTVSSSSPSYAAATAAVGPPSGPPGAPPAGLPAGIVKYLVQDEYKRIVKRMSIR